MDADRQLTHRAALAAAAAARPLGIRCPNCGCPALEVLQTRRAADGRILRRRRCRRCGQRVSTSEHVVSSR